MALLAGITLPHPMELKLGYQVQPEALLVI